jgi:hypothetical protein
LLSARRFVECFLSGTRQSPTLGNDRVYREQGSQHRNTLGKEICAECQTLGKQRPSAKGRLKLRTVIFAERRALTLGKEVSLPSVLLICRLPSSTIFLPSFCGEWPKFPSNDDKENNIRSITYQFVVRTWIISSFPNSLEYCPTT